MKEISVSSKIKIIIPCVIAGVLLAVYLGFAIFFTGHFEFNTFINGEDVSLFSLDEANGIFTSEVGKYELTVSGRDDLSYTIAGADIDIEPQFKDKIEGLLSSENVFAWPLSLFTNTNYEADLVTDYSKDELSNCIDEMISQNNSNLTEPVDATYEMGEAKFEIVPEVPGNKIIRSKAEDIITNAILELRDEINLDKEENHESAYEEPLVYSDDEDLNTLVTNLNKYASSSFEYVFGDNTELVNGPVIQDFLDIDGTNVTLNEDEVKEYINSLARKYDTFGKSRTLHTALGEDISVSGGDYGWWMDRNTTTANLVDALKLGSSGGTTELEPVYFGTAASYGDNDYGTSYVEIDLDNQHVYVYQDGKLVVESDCVSGKAVLGNGTPDGTYSITYKEKDATLNGENYSSPVKYWMPFNGNIGMHDASWRSSFGGKIYVTSGSHGCINLPSAKAAEIFDAVTKHEAVIVYGGMTKDEAVTYVKKSKKEDNEENSSESSASVAGASASSSTSAGTDASTTVASDIAGTASSVQ